jgi:hypothetical protein
MKFIIVLFLLILVIMALHYTISNRRINKNIFEEEKSEEALQWLKNNKNSHAFAGNRFGETKNAIEFVEKLYKAGAEEVRVTGIFDEPERIEEEGGAYADTLIVKLPDEKNKRLEIFKIYRYELNNYDFNSGEDIDDEGQELIEFWWD